MAVLSENEIKAFTASELEWKYEGGELVRNYSFEDFASSMKFVNQVAELAESANHHPDIDIRYNKVRLGLVSHDVGGITGRDIRMAKNISQLG